MLLNTQTDYGWPAKTLHWLIGLLIIGMLALGLTMGDFEGDTRFALYGIHKSIGAIILGLVVLRLLWRWTNYNPLLPEDFSPLGRLAARGGHFLLYVCMLAMPLSGWVLSNAAGYPVSVFGWFNLPAIVGKNHDLHELAEEVHEWVAYGLIALIIGHIAAALYHHFIRKDLVLRRMLPCLRCAKSE